MVNTIPKIISHRGGRRWAPENTLAGFKKTVEFGADGVEFDVHRCASGELVVIHDDDLARTTNGVGLIKEASYAELKRLSAGRWFAPEFESERIPLLSEVLDVFDDRILINIEIKNAPIGYPGIEEDLLETLSGYKHKDNVLVSSFDHYCLKRLREADKSVKIGVLQAGMFLGVRQYAEQFGASHYIQAFDCLLPEGIDEAHAAGLEVVVWTLNSPAQWKMAVERRVDAICTDDPEGCRRYLSGLKAGGEVSAAPR